MKCLHFTRYEDKNESVVFDLFEQVFGRKMTPEFWNWRYKNHFGDPIRYLMWEEEQLIGHYVVHPIPFKLGNNVENVLFSMAVMTHSGYRGRGIFPKLGELVYKDAKQLGYKMAIGFPNRNSYRIHFEKMGWTSFGQITEFEMKLSYDSKGKDGPANYTINKVKRFDDQIDMIWNANRNKFSFMFPRDKVFLNWRYDDHPVECFTGSHPYIYHKFILSLNDRPTAYFVLKQFGEEKGHIVDFFGEINEKTMNVIIDYSISFFRDRKLPALSFWSSRSEDVRLSRMYESLGFVKHSSDAYFGIKILGSNLPESITDFTQWFVRMGDSDVY